MTDTVLEIVKKVRKELTLDGMKRVFDDGSKLSSEHLKEESDPEAFTREFLIEPIFKELDIEFHPEKHFRGVKNTLRKVDYSLKTKSGILVLAEAKPINADLYEKSPDGAVNQIVGLFRLAEVRDSYAFGIATDGLRWVFIDNKGTPVFDHSLENEFSEIEDIIIEKREVLSESVEEEITKKFYEWYNALLHGGTYRDHDDKVRKISDRDCFTNNITSVSESKEREQLSQTIMDRLIFIKFLQTKGIIQTDALEYLSNLDENILNERMKQLFFQVINVKKTDRVNIDDHFQDVPYLNGDLFMRTDIERDNPDYRVRSLILKKVIQFLDSFSFLSEEGLEKQQYLDPEILGYIFERAMTATDRKGTGAYYTPRPITRYISENTIYPAMLSRINSYLYEEKGFKESELLDRFERLFILKATTLEDILQEVIMKFKICDNACGSGAFLLAAANVLFSIYKRINEELRYKHSDAAIKSTILLFNLFGVDINPNAVEITKLRLWLWLAGSFDPKSVDTLANIDYNLRVGNSLLGYHDIGLFLEEKVTLIDYFSPEESMRLLIEDRGKLLESYKQSTGRKAQDLKDQIVELTKKTIGLLNYRLYEDTTQKIDVDREEFLELKPFHWGFEFYKVLGIENSEERGFDVLIGNPPYGLLRKIFPNPDTQKLHTAVYNSVYELQSGNRNLYKLFLERSTHLLRKQGFFGMIFPTAFFGESSSTQLRKHLIENSTVSRILQFPEKTRVFVGVTQDVSIMIYEDIPPPKGRNYAISIASQIGDKELQTLSSIEYIETNVESLAEISHSGYAIPTLENPSTEWEILTHVVQHPPMKGNEDNPPLAEAFEGHLHETADKKHMSSTKTSDILVKGIHLDRYHVNLREDGRSPRWLSDKVGFFEKKPAAAEAAKRIKIIGKSTINKQTPRRMQFSILEPNLVVTNNVKFLFVSKDTRPGFLLAVLNSGLAEWFISKFATTNRITNYEVENIPIPRCADTQQALYDVLSDTLLHLRNQEDYESMKIVDLVLDACLYDLYLGLKTGIAESLSNLIKFDDPNERLGVLKESVKSSELLGLIKKIYQNNWVKCVCQVLRNRGIDISP